MPISTHCIKVLFAALAILLLAATGFAQRRTLVEEDWYGDVKKVLMDHYTGKTVRLKLPIPATRRGLEVYDGAVQTEASKATPQFAAQIGDEVTIKSFKVGDSGVEVLLSKNEPPRKGKIPNPFAVWKQPRINLRFSHELSSKDLTIENLNRFLAPAVDITPLTPTVSENNSNAPQAATAVPPASQQAAPQPGQRAESNPAEQSMPMPSIVADLQSAGPDVGELTVEASVKGARVYIDGSYSGEAPRTVRLRAGIHTILVVGEGYASWEQRLFIPGAKASVVRAELNK
jgi:hypothetical protein